MQRQRLFPKIEDYHQNDPDIRVERADWPHLRVSVLAEASGDVRFEQTALHGLVMTLDGTEAHLTRMDGIDDESPTAPGSICAIPAGVEVHLAWRNLAPVQRTIMIEFDPDLFQTYAAETVTHRFADGHLVPMNFCDRPALGELARLLAREVDADHRRGRLFAETAARLLALELAASSWSQPAAPLRGLQATDRRVALAIDFIEANFARDLSLIEICSASGISPAHLTVLFRAATGLSPYSYVIDRRLTRADKLLRSTDLPVAIVALEAGFCDQPHLTRVMRARMNCTPGTIRREAQRAAAH